MRGGDATLRRLQEEAFALRVVVGLPMQEVARRLGRHRTTIWRWLRRAGPQLRLKWWEHFYASYARAWGWSERVDELRRLLMEEYRRGSKRRYRRLLREYRLARRCERAAWREYKRFLPF